MSEQKVTNLSEFITEQFGANASYVEGLLSRYRDDPNSVDESWRTYFAELMNGASPAERENGRSAAESETSANLQPSKPESGAAAVAPAAISPKEKKAAALGTDVEIKPIIGPAKKIVENMEESLTVPTATSTRQMPVKLLEENRRIINENLAKTGRGKASYTHLIGWMIVKSLQLYPQLNEGFTVASGNPARFHREGVNLGIAIDVQKKDGSRTLMVPNIKGAEKMNFAQFLDAYDDVVKRAREGKLTIPDFEGTTISLTNPGTIGTIASNPRLMSGQGIIIATGAIGYPAEYQGMTPEALSQLGISKVVNISSTYDHRIIQGAESGLLLKQIHELMLGQHNFYDDVFRDLEINYSPLRWAIDRNPSLFGGDRIKEQTTKQARVLELINAYRIRGHLLADIDPLNMTRYHATELDLENYDLTIWDLDREFISGGLHGMETATLRAILDILRKAYCGKVGIEYRHIQSKDEKNWIRKQVRRAVCRHRAAVGRGQKTTTAKTYRSRAVRTISA